MKKVLAFIALAISLFGLVASCQDEDKVRKEQQERQQAHSDSVFTYLENNWKFIIQTDNKELEEQLKNWESWSYFSEEILLKPVTSTNAYHKKAELLESRVQSIIYSKYPELLNTMAIKSRTIVLLNTIRNLKMFLLLDPVDINKLDENIKEVNLHIKMLISKMEEEIRKNEFPKQLGEEEFLQLMDTVRRANSSNN